MGSNPCFVQATVSGCVIYRDVNGSYLVSRQDRPLKKRASRPQAGPLPSNGSEFIRTTVLDGV
jgi:hypothetical protein